jgi:hypothetical protein
MVNPTKAATAGELNVGVYGGRLACRRKETMKKIREVGNQPLTWHQFEECKASWELRAGDDVVGTVAWQNPTGGGTLALAASADGRWSFKRVGVFIPTVTVRVAGTDTDVATVSAHLGRSVVYFADGRAVHFIRSSFWRSEFAFTLSNGEPLLAFKEGGTRVEFAQGAVTIPDASLLALLGCYLLVLHARDAQYLQLLMVSGS